MDGAGQLEHGRADVVGLEGRTIGTHSLRVRLRVTVFVIDMFAIALAFLIASLVLYTNSSWFAVLCVVLPIFCGTAVNSNAYTLESICRASLGITQAFKALLFTTGAMFLIAYFLRTELYLSRFLLLVTVVLAAAAILAFRQAFAVLIERRWADKLVAEMVVLDRVTIDVPHAMMRVDAQAVDIRPDLNDPAMLDRFAWLMRGVDRVVVACPPEARKSWAMLLKGANIVGEVLVDDIDEIGAIGLNFIEQLTTLTVSVGPLNLTQRIAKRTFDLVLSIAALTALTPVLLLIAVAIKLDSRGPVFFRQRRVGRANAFFSILKFRSMYADRTDSEGVQSARRGDARVTRVGWFLRRTSLDELPQLINVLGGSMSLVGPRPHALGSLAGESLFWEIDERYWHRHVLKPGITGLAQVRGYRGATHHRDDLTNRLQADLEYAADWSLWRDVSILISTLGVLVHRNSF